MPKHSLGQASLTEHAPGCAVAHAAIVTHSTISTGYPHHKRGFPSVL